MIIRPTKEEVQRAACILAYSGHKFVNTAELAALREQVKALQKALGKIAILSDEAVTLRIANDVLEQTKPKEGE